MELQELLDEMELKIEGELTPETFREAFTSTYIAKKNAVEDDEIRAAVNGKILGSIQTAMNRTAKQMGFDIDLKGKKIEESLAEFPIYYQSQIEKIKESNGKPDKQVVELETQLNKWKQDYGQLETQHKTLADEFNGFKTDKDNEIKNFKIQHQYNDVFSKIPMDEKANPFLIKGLKSTFQEGYQLALDENEQLEVRDKSGAKIAKANNNGFLSLEDVLKKLAEDAGVLKKNNLPASGATRTFVQPPAPTNTNPNLVNRAAGRAEELRAAMARSQGK